MEKTEYRLKLEAMKKSLSLRDVHIISRETRLSTKTVRMTFLVDEPSQHTDGQIRVLKAAIRLLDKKEKQAKELEQLV